jgi:hypothetical protein
MNAQLEGTEVEQEVETPELGAEIEQEEVQYVEGYEGIDPEIAQKAKAMGHVPQDVFRGDPDNWVDAEEFVRRGENHMGIVKSRLSRTEQALEDMRKQNASLTKVITERFNKEHEQGEMHLRSKRKEALEAGDGEAFERYDKALNDHQANKPEVEQPADGQPQVAPEVQAMTEAFMSRNTWYGQNQEMTEYAEFIGTKLNQAGIQGQQFFEQLETRVKQAFPANGGRGRQQVAGQRRPTGGKKVISAASLNNEERAAGEYLVREGSFKSLDDYAKALKGGK